MLCRLSALHRFLWPKPTLHGYVTFTELSVSWWTFQFFPFFATLNITAMNSHLQAIVEIYVFISLEYMCRQELPGHMVNSMLNFLRGLWDCFPKSGCTIYISTCNTLWSQLLHILANMCHYLFLKATSVSIKWCLSVFYLNFSKGWWCWTSFYVFIGNLCFWRNNHIVLFVRCWANFYWR